MQDTNPIGAYATIKFLDDHHEVSQVYISFGQYDDETEKDSYGINDNHIFYYCDEGEEDFKSLVQEGAEDFIVLNYELAYREAL